MHGLVIDNSTNFQPGFHSAPSELIVLIVDLNEQNLDRT